MEIVANSDVDNPDDEAELCENGLDEDSDGFEDDDSEEEQEEEEEEEEDEYEFYMGVNDERNNHDVNIDGNTNDQEGDAMDTSSSNDSTDEEMQSEIHDDDTNDSTDEEMHSEIHDDDMSDEYTQTTTMTTPPLNGPKLSLKVGWKYVPQRLRDLNMELSKSQPKTPGDGVTRGN